MPDYNPNPSGEGPMRRPVRAPPPRRYGPGGLPTEGADPPPRVHPAAPWIALLFVVGFLALQLWPATHLRHPKDPSRSWVEIKKTASGETDHQATMEEAHRVWFGREVGGGAIQKQQNAGMDEVLALHQITAHESLRRQMAQDVQIVLSTDEKDLRPLGVVINSTISNTRHPERIKFHVVIPASDNQLEYYKLKTFFPKASIDIISEGIDFAKISELIKYRKDSKARKELTTPYNFLLYYLPQLLNDKDIDKFIYLDTDVVVKGNIEELFRKGLEGYPVAAVKDCSQQFETYFDFKQLKEILTRENGSKAWLPREQFDETECVFNRGALVIDVKQWIQQNVTETIEWWMKEFNNANDVLFKYGLSQPPFLLALYRNYKVLVPEWNVRGLGRNKFSNKEMDYFAELYGSRPQKKPFVSLESDYANILHFNGEFKPWKRGRMRSPDEDVVSLCGEEGKECYRLWWEYLDKSAEAALK